MNSMNSKNSYRIIVLVSTAIVLSVWWWPYFTKGWLPLSEWGYGLIWGDWLSDRLWLVFHKIIPEWNPNNVLGVNYIGRDPFNNPLSLGNIFKFFFFDPKAEWVCGIFFFMLIMGLGTYHFLLTQNISRKLAILGAILIVLYPKWMDDMHHGPGKFMNAYSILPWILLIIFHMFKIHPRLLHFIILGILGAVVFLGSGAWASVLVSYLIVPYFFYRIIVYLLRNPEKRNIALFKGLAGVSLTLLIALGLSSYLLLPLWDNIRLSSRSLYVPPAGYGLLDFIGLFFPWQGRLYTMGYYDLPLPLPFGIGIVSNFRSYFGILAIPLLIYVLIKPDLRKKYLFFWVWPLLIAFLFSRFANKFFPLTRIFEKFLGAQSSENFLFYGVIFCFNILSVVALNDLYKISQREGKDRCSIVAKNALVNKIAVALMAFYTVAIGIWISLWFLTHYYPTLFTRLLRLSPFNEFKNLVGIQLLFYSYFYDYFFYLILISFVIRFAIVWWFRSGQFLKQKYGLVILGSLMIFDFLLFPKIIYPFTSSLDLRYSHTLEQNAFVRNIVKSTERISSHSIYDKSHYKLTQFKNFVKNNYVDRRFWDPEGMYKDFNAVNPDYGFFEPLFDPGISYYAVTVGKQIYNYHESLLPEYFYDFDRTLNGKNEKYYRGSWNSLWDPSSPLVNVAGISYIFWYQPIESENLELVGRYSIGDGFIYRNTKAVPKAYLVSHLEYFDKRKDLLERMQAPSFNPREMVTTEDSELADLFSSIKRDKIITPGKVNIAQYNANKILLNVKVNQPSILVVTDLFFPYWTAMIDNTSSKIYRVNCVFRGLIVEKGEHQILMEFYNIPFHKGLRISLVTLIFTCLFLIINLVLLFQKKALI